MFQLPRLGVDEDRLARRSTGSGCSCATNVSDEQNTVSPGFTPSSSSARWIAAVPELTAAAWPTPDHRRQLALERVDVRAQRRDPVGPEGLLDELASPASPRCGDDSRMLLVDARADRAGRTGLPGAIDHGKMVDLVLVHQVERALPREADLAGRPSRCAASDRRRVVEPAPMRAAERRRSPSVTVRSKRAVVRPAATGCRCPASIEPVQRLADVGRAGDASCAKSINRCSSSSLLAGTPAQMDFAGASRARHAPAPITASSSTAMPGRTFAPAPTRTRSPTRDAAAQRRVRREMASTPDRAVMVDDRSVVDDRAGADMAHRARRPLRAATNTPSPRTQNDDTRAEGWTTLVRRQPSAAGVRSCGAHRIGADGDVEAEARRAKGLRRRSTAAAEHLPAAAAQDRRRRSVAPASASPRQQRVQHDPAVPAGTDDEQPSQ